MCQDTQNRTHNAVFYARQWAGWRYRLARLSPPTNATESDAYRGLSAIGGTTVGRTDERHHTRLWCARTPEFRGTRVIWRHRTAATITASTVIKLIASYHGRLLFVINFIYGISLRRSTLQNSFLRRVRHQILYITDHVQHFIINKNFVLAGRLEENSWILINE